ncbi:GNAT family N-acetyltransferase [Ktedonobacteria bacterium brp13]|nr:GNAT family N-acetyltransferase [Ktedonobacteria bacterium brp13]
MVNVASLPAGFRVRPATMDDLEAVAHVQIAHEVADFNTPLSNETSLRHTWQSPGINLKTDTWVVEAPDGQIVSYAQVRGRAWVRIFSTVWLLPDYQGRGIGRHLLHLAEAQARRHVADVAPDVRITMGASWISERNQAAQHLLKREGYQKIYSFSSMKLDLDTPPPAPVWNDGIVVRPFQPGEDEQATYEADEEISQDERGHIPLAFKEWQQQNLSDTTSIFLAWDAEKIAGLIIGVAKNNQGWIWHLGVRRPWRKQGLGMALLRQAQGEFYRRGLHAMNLNVDTLNLTGAFQLYERAGMHTLFQYHTYEKELRAGKDLRVQ